MQKITGAKNKTSNSRTNVNLSQSHTTPQRKKISQQSIREFKIEIDHEIAKCLDTLDRQGLKFLKQTLKTSSIFNSTNLEIEDRKDKETNQCLKGHALMFQSSIDDKIKPSQQQSQKSIRKDSSNDIKKAFLKNKEQKQQNQTQYRTNSSARLKAASVVRQTQDEKAREKARPVQSQNIKKRQTYQNAQTTRTKQKEAPQIKQYTNSRVVKKTVIENKKTNQRIGLGEKISKKMQELNIKKVGTGKKESTGKKEIAASNKKSHLQQKASNHNQPQQLIEEDIIETIQNQIEEDATQNESQQVIQSLIKSSIGSFHQFVASQIKISQKINPLKPFAKDRLNQSETMLFESKMQQTLQQPLIIENKSVQKLSASIQVDNEDLNKNASEKNKSKEMSMIVEKINKLSPEKLMEIQKYLDFIQNNSVEDERQFKSNVGSHMTQEKNKFENSTTVLRNQVPKTLPEVHSMDQFERIEAEERQQNQHKLFHRSSNFNQDRIVSNNVKPLLMIPKSQSRKGIREKKEKASMIYATNSKSSSRSRIKVQLDFEELQRQKQNPHCVLNQTIKNETMKPIINIQSGSNFVPSSIQQIMLQSEKPLKMEKIDYKDSIQNQNEVQGNLKKSFIQPSIKNLQKLSEKKRSIVEQQTVHDRIQNENNLGENNRQYEDKAENQLNIEYTEVKMLNINNKKIPVIKKVQNRTQLKFKILSNQGHPSLFGLTGIQLFTIDNKRVIFTEKQLGLNQASMPKLLYLFNGSHLTNKEENIYLSPLNKNQIIVELDKQNDKIGGILVFNFNKSSLESQKEVDQMEIYHNDSKMWKGTISPGAYNDSTNYATQIQFMPNFKFPNYQEAKMNEKIASKLQKSKIWIDDYEKNKTIQASQKKTQKQSSQKWLYKSENRRININFTERQTSKDQIKAQFQQHQRRISQTKINLPNELQNVNKLESHDRVLSFASLPKSSLPKNLQNITKQKSYDQFDSMLKGLQENINREKSKSKLPLAIVSQQDKFSKNQNKEKIMDKEVFNQAQKAKNEEKIKISRNEIDDFMKDSMFNEKPAQSRIPSVKRKIQPPKRQQREEQSAANFETKKEQSLQKKKNDINIDDFLGELQDVMKSKGTSTKRTNQPEKKFSIPNLPQGYTVQLEILQNWGHQAYVGLQSIQFFDKDGKIFDSNQISCNKNPQNIDLLKTLNNKKIMNRDEKIQTKVGFEKGSSTVITFKFTSSKIFSLIRIWNYNGHRVHSNVGIKNLLIKIDGRDVFMGQLNKNQSTPETLHKYFEAILFTSDHFIVKKIKENDWLTQLRNKIKEEKALFKSTLINFNRPKTRNQQQKGLLKQNSQTIVQTNLKQIKLSKRACWEYEPPEMPEGNIFVFLLHETWGDQDFIGLNGIQIFDSIGKIVTKDQISNIKAFPSSTGEKNDKRVIENVVNGSNLSSLDTNIWLSTFQSDIQKLQSGQSNTIIVELYKSTKVSGINIYNYSKTPERGVREIQIQVNSFTAFRGYLKIFDESNAQNCLHTTINFTKNLQLLTKINFEGYNEDNIDQNVCFVNERKVVKV